MVKGEIAPLYASRAEVEAAQGGGLIQPAEEDESTLTVSLLRFEHILQCYKLVLQFPCILIREVVLLLVIF